MIHIAHIASDAKDAWGKAVPFETWFVSLDGKAWLEVTKDPHGATTEQVKPLFAGERNSCRWSEAEVVPHPHRYPTDPKMGSRDTAVTPYHSRTYLLPYWDLTLLP